MFLVSVKYMPCQSAFLHIMANFVFHTVFSDSELLEVKNKLKMHTGGQQNSYSCHKWQGSKDKDGYGLLWFKFRGRRVRVKVHRLCFYIHHGFPLMDGKNVSHICHSKNCINVNHLSLESTAVNNKRKICLNDGECMGHWGHKRCILRYTSFVNVYSICMLVRNFLCCIFI